LLLPVKPLDVFRGIETDVISTSDRTSSLGEWAVALGLALKGFPNATRAEVGAHDDAAEAFLHTTVGVRS
jgi:hypothetical protein